MLILRVKTLLVFSIVVMVLMMGTVTAAGSVAIAVNGEFVDVDEVRFFNDSIHVPARTVFEQAGATVTWSRQGTIIETEQRSVVVSLSPDNEGIQGVLDSGTLLVPVRQVAQDLGLSVVWKGPDRIVHVISPEFSEVRDVTLAARGEERRGDFSQDDIVLMARMVEAETYGEPYEGKVAVAAVILNRLDHSSFPETVSRVIYQQGQFATHSHIFNWEPRQVAIDAVQDAIDGQDPSLGAIYFFNPSRSNNAFLHSRPVTVNIANHRFMK